MKFLVLHLCLSMGLLLAPASGRSQFDPMPGHPHKDQKGFMEWLFSHHNSQRIDYGAKIEHVRQEAVDSLRSGQFWGQVIPWCWVLVMFVRLWHQEKIREQRLTISARLLARVYNAFADSRQQALSAIRKHNEVVDLLNNPAHNPAFARASQENAVQKIGERPQPKPSNTAPAATQGGSSKAGNSGTTQPTAGSNKEKKPVPESPVGIVDYIAQINALQAQLTASCETAKNKQSQVDRQKNEIDRLQGELDKFKGKDPNSGDKDPQN